MEIINNFFFVVISYIPILLGYIPTRLAEGWHTYNFDRFGTFNCDLEFVFVYLYFSEKANRVAWVHDLFLSLGLPRKGIFSVVSIASRCYCNLPFSYIFAMEFAGVVNVSRPFICSL